MAERLREKAGWATKQGGTIVRKRWFVLKDQHLHYYKTPTVRAQPTPTPGRMGPRGPPGKERAQLQMWVACARGGPGIVCNRRPRLSCRTRRPPARSRCADAPLPRMLTRAPSRRVPRIALGRNRSVRSVATALYAGAPRCTPFHREACGEPPRSRRALARCRAHLGAAVVGAHVASVPA